MTATSLDLYERNEIDLLFDAPTNSEGIPQLANGIRKRRDRGGLSHKLGVYNLTVEIDRTAAERVFTDDALRKLGYSSISEYIRRCVEKLCKRYEKLLAKESTKKE